MTIRSARVPTRRNIRRSESLSMSSRESIRSPGQWSWSSSEESSCNEDLPHFHSTFSQLPWSRREISIDHRAKTPLLIVCESIAFAVEDTSYESEQKILQRDAHRDRSRYAVRYFSRSLNAGGVEIKSLKRTDPERDELVFAGGGGAQAIAGDETGGVSRRFVDVVEFDDVFVWWNGRLIKFIFYLIWSLISKKKRRRVRSKGLCTI